jgi:hypothetical protein
MKRIRNPTGERRPLLWIARLAVRRMQISYGSDT